MPEEWTKDTELGTLWVEDTFHIAKGWGDLWGYFPWGEHELLDEFELSQEEGVNTLWEKQ